MNVDRIKEIQQKTAYPDSRSVQQALLQVWNECAQEQLRQPHVVVRSEQLICECDKPSPNDRGFNWCNNCNRFLTPQQQIN
jgi:hypothetical protein